MTDQPGQVTGDGQRHLDYERVGTAPLRFRLHRDAVYQQGRDCAVTAPRSRLRIQLLGGFTVRLDDGPALPLPARKAQALLAYLAVPPGRRHSREKLTALLWGDTPDAQARQAFRQTLSRLRRAIAEGSEVLT